VYASKFGEGGGKGLVFVVPMMEIYPKNIKHMICDLHYGDRRSD
jgi:hypothetical protein